MGPGNYGQFVDKNGVDAKDFVLSKLKVAETKVKKAIDALTAQAEKTSADQTEANKAKLTNVLSNIEEARGKVNAIRTGANFKDLESTDGKGGHAKTALDAVNSIVENQIGSVDIPYGSGKEIQASNITGPITEAINKFEIAKTNGVGEHTTHKEPVNSKNWNICRHDLWEWLYSLEIGNWKS